MIGVFASNTPITRSGDESGSSEGVFHKLRVALNGVAVRNGVFEILITHGDQVGDCALAVEEGEKVKEGFISRGHCSIGRVNVGGDGTVSDSEEILDVETGLNTGLVGIVVSKGLLNGNGGKIKTLLKGLEIFGIVILLQERGDSLEILGICGGNCDVVGGLNGLWCCLLVGLDLSLDCSLGNSGESKHSRDEVYVRRKRGGDGIVGERTEEEDGRIGMDKEVELDVKKTLGLRDGAADLDVIHEFLLKGDRVFVEPGDDSALRLIGGFDDLVDPVNRPILSVRRRLWL